MRRVARVLGLIGGIGALAWAMRDRFVSVAISREPVAPAFKVPDHPAPAPMTSTGGEITSVAGIGPVYATRLDTIGVSTLADLAAARAEQVAAAAEVPLSRAIGWIDAARGRDEKPDGTDSNPS